MQNVAPTDTRFNESMVTIIVADMERSIDFYSKRLGLPFIRRQATLRRERAASPLAWASAR